MLKEKKINTDILDKAIAFAVKAHSGTERKGKGLPYIVHPLEAVSIAAMMTNDQELLAAAALHDVVEDTEITIEEIRKEFGNRIASLVETESEEKIEGRGEDTWHERKEKAIKKLFMASREAKIVALGDKLSNIRAIFHDYQKIGDKLWDRFHTKNPFDHEWHYRMLVEALSELEGYGPYSEFKELTDRVFLQACRQFRHKSEGNRHFLCGSLTGKDILPFLLSLNPNEKHILDFSMAGDISFSGMRALIKAKEHGIKFVIVNAKPIPAKKLATSGLGSLINITSKPLEIELEDGWKKSGDGFTAVTYNNSDGDSLLKLYSDFIPVENIEHEKNIGLAAVKSGINTPLSGLLVTCRGKNGIIFELIKDKVSIARAVSQQPEKIEHYAKIFADECKKLHSTPCDKSVFPNVKDIYREIIRKSKNFTENEKKKITNFLESVKDEDTYIHGDLHPGNLIMANGETLFIDMADLCYGSHLIDLGATFFCLNCSDDELANKLFHSPSATMRKFWSIFSSYYFGADTQEKQKEVNKMMMPYAALKTLFFGELHQMEPQMKQFIQENLIKQNI